MASSLIHTVFSLPSSNNMEAQDEIKNQSRLLPKYSFRLTALLILLIFYIGFQVEQWNINHLPETSTLYETDQVCGLNIPPEYANGFFSKEFLSTNFSESIPSKSVTVRSRRESSILLKSKHQKTQQQERETNYPPLTSVTYDFAEIVREKEGIVQHCGNCGQCSNPQDVAIYDDTRNTLFHSTLQCSMHALTRGRQAVSDCLQQSVGFTEKCNDCWVDNVMCDARNCLFTCAWTALFSPIRAQGSTDDAPQQLNACLQCDEKRCGPAFLKCAGANRRRAGILSDIRRDQFQVCPDVDKEWWKSESLQNYYKLTVKG